MEKSRREQFVEQAICYYIYEGEYPDWSGLEKELLNLGYTHGEAYKILYDVRQGGH